MSSEIDLIYREWQEAIRDRFNIKGEQVVVAKPSNPAHLSILKEMCLGAGFTSDQANSILLILQKDKKTPPKPDKKEREEKYTSEPPPIPDKKEREEKKRCSD